MEQVEHSKVFFRESDQLYRRCAMCKKIKPIDHFSTNPQMRGGVNAYCKPCACIYNARTRKPGGQKDYFKKWYAKNRQTRLDRHKNNPDRAYAHGAIKEAVRKGEVVPLDYCQMCGCRDREIIAHHADYSKPLVVIWLCKSCHRFHHINNVNLVG